MASWNSLSKYYGYRVSPILTVNLDGDGALTQFTWDATTPSGTSLTFQTNVSFDGGFTWNGWKDVVNNGVIPDINSTTNCLNVKIQYRSFFNTNTNTLTPELRSVTMTLTPVINFANNGDVGLKPELWITKVGTGDISIINTTSNNREFKFTGLTDGETVYVNCERQYIESSIALTYRYNNFNDTYLDLVTGNNILKITGNCNLNFRYQFKMLQG